MKENLHQKTIKDYDTISTQFSQTRKFLWPEFAFFEKYLKPNQKILDLGCGNGRLSSLILKKNCEYVGIDNSKGQINEAKKLFPELEFKTGDLMKIPLPDENVDQIWTIASFHHLADKKSRERSLEEMKRVLKKDGIIIMTNWNLFQGKYKKYVHKAIIDFIKNFGRKNNWNDTFIPWKSGEKEITKRYYHAFTPWELNKLFKQNNLRMIESFFSKKSKKVKFWNSFNLCHVLKK